SFQIYTFIVIGTYFGYKLENIADKILSAAQDDAQQIVENPTITKSLHALYAARYRAGATLLGAIAFSTLTVFSPAGASLLALTGGNAFAAGSMVMGGITTA